MGWEIRRNSPSDEVIVPTSGDPFGPPKWAPPVHHMPEWIVLIVQFCKGLYATLAFLVRHPLATGLTALLAWLYWAYGWPAPVLLVAALSMTLGAWAFFGWVSFLRWLIRPMRAKARRFFIYRRHWQPVMVMSGLAFYRNQREYLPVLKKVECTPTTDRVLVKMLSGQAPGIWEDHTANLAHGFGAQVCRIRTAQKPGWIWLELVRKDSLAKPLDALAVPARAEDIDLARVPIGMREDGSAYRLRLEGSHVLIAGATGAGKGSFQWSIVRALLPAILAGLVEVWGIDPKRMELSFGRRVFRRYSDDPKGGMVELLEDAVAEMNARADRFGGKTRTFTPTRENPFVIVMVDELAFLTAYQPDRGLRKRADAAIATLTSQGRSVGFCVVGALQDPRKDVINIRNLFPTRIGLRLDESDQVDMVLGDGMRDRGAYADLISVNPAIGAGVAYVRIEEHPDPVRVRSGYVADDDIRAMEQAVQARPADSTMQAERVKSTVVELRSRERPELPAGPDDEEAA